MISQDDMQRLRGYETAQVAVPEIIDAPAGRAKRQRPALKPTFPISRLKVLIPRVRRFSGSRKVWAGKKWLLTAVVASGLIAAGGLGYLVWHGRTTATDPVPTADRTAVDYPVYYPDAAKLPDGYLVDSKSFSHPSTGVIVYDLTDAKNQKLVVSLQDKPSASDLKAFDDYRLPLHSDVNTPIGQAAVGAIGNQTVASLPTDSKAWLIVTAPAGINQTDLKQLLQSFRP